MTHSAPSLKPRQLLGLFLYHLELFFIVPWINDEAEREGLNFSHTLNFATRNRLGIREEKEEDVPITTVDGEETFIVL